MAYSAANFRNAVYGSGYTVLPPPKPVSIYSSLYERKDQY